MNSSLAMHRNAPGAEEGGAAVAYEAMVEAYQQSLVNRLRGHSAGAAYLELWVPDEDPVKSLANMVEAAQAAGRETLVVEISRQTLDGSRMPELLALLSEIGSAQVDTTASGFALRVSDLQAPRTARSASPAHPPQSARGKDPAASGMSPHRVPSVSQAAAVELHPTLTAAVAALGSAAPHEGSVGERPGLIRLDAQGHAGRLSVLVDPQEHRVHAARHADARTPVRRALLDLMCRLAEGRPVQDVSDHVGILALHHLAHEAKGRPVPGILLPQNAGQAFVTTLELFRSIRSLYAARSDLRGTENLFEMPPGADWTALSPAEKLVRARAVAAEFASARGLPADAVSVESVERDILGFDVRVVLSLNEAVSATDKPALARTLERELKRRLDDKLQAHLEPLRDKNKLRRSRAAETSP